MLIAVAVIVPLVVLAGLFIWLKLTEEADEEALELEPEAVASLRPLTSAEAAASSGSAGAGPPRRRPCSRRPPGSLC